MIGKVVIIGSGQAGVSVAFKLRSFGYQGKITLISEEPYIPYHRPPLSKKYIANLVDEDRLYLKQPAIYESEQIELLLDCKVTEIHRNRKQLVLKDGVILDYDFLVLATGASARRIPEELGGYTENVYTVRNLSDARLLREEFKKNRNLLIIGGGYIGLETAAVARNLGLNVTLIEREDRILARVASPITADYLKKLHQQNGVSILEKVGLEHFEIEGNKATKAIFTDGTVIDLDVVVVGIGVFPEITLAKNADLAVGNGVIVDRYCRTSDPEIYALGDCACFPYQDEQIRLESVQNAVDMADVVSKAIMGQAAEYLCFPWFWSDQYSTKLQIAGLNKGYTHVVVRQKNNSCISIWYFNQEKLISVDAINDPKSFMTAKRWLSEELSPDLLEIEDVSLELNEISLSKQFNDFSKRELSNA